MAVERIDNDMDSPEITEMGSSVSVFPESTRQEQIQNAAEILVSEDQFLIDDEIDAVPEEEQMPFDANLVEFISKSELSALSSDILSSVEQDKNSRSEWEKTYTDGLKYLGMKFDESRSQPFEGSSGVIHPILAEAVTQFQAQAYKEIHEFLHNERNV